MALVINATIPESVKEGELLTMSVEASGALMINPELAGPFEIDYNYAKTAGGALTVDTEDDTPRAYRNSTITNFGIRFTVNLTSIPTVAHTIFECTDYPTTVFSIGINAEGRWVCRMYADHWTGGDFVGGFAVLGDNVLSIRQAPKLGADFAIGNGVVGGVLVGGGFPAENLIPVQNFYWYGNPDFTFILKDVYAFTDYMQYKKSDAEMVLGFGTKLVPIEDYKYTWLKDWTPVSSTKTFMKLAEVSDAGQYTVSVSAGGQGGHPPLQTLTVTPYPTSYPSMSGAVVLGGSSASLSSPSMSGSRVIGGAESSLSNPAMTASVVLGGAESTLGSPALCASIVLGGAASTRTYPELTATVVTVKGDFGLLFTDITPNIAAYEGDDVIIRATLYGAQSGLRVWWKKDGVVIPGSQLSIILSAIELDDIGTYMCFATDHRGVEVESAPVVVSVTEIDYTAGITVPETVASGGPGVWVRQAHSDQAFELKS